MFKLIKIENGRINVPEPVSYAAKASEAIVAGEALVLSGGVLTKATEAPEYIALASVSADAANRVIPVTRITSDQVYEVEVSAAPTSLMAGDKVTLADDGQRVTATTADGYITVVSLEGATAVGDKIIVRF